MEESPSEVSAVKVDLRFWHHLHALAFDDVMRSVCDLEAGAEAGRLGQVRNLVGDWFDLWTRPDGARADAALTGRLERLLRAALYVHFEQRTLYWMDHLPLVEAEYQRRMGVLKGEPLAPDDLKPYVDRGEAVS